MTFWDYAMNTQAQPRGQAFVERVFTATLQQLATVGFERLTIPEVAELADANKTSIYRRWPNKTELVRAAIQSNMEGMGAHTTAGNLRADLLAIAQQASAFLESPLGKGVFLMLLTQRNNPELRDLTESLLQSSGAGLPATLLAQSQARGEIADNADIQLLLSTVAGAVMHRVFVERAVLSTDYLERLINLVLHGAANSSAPA